MSERWSDAAMNTAIKIMVGAAIGGGLATGFATIADNANAHRIDVLATETATWRMGVVERLTAIELQMGILADRQIRIQQDVTEIKQAQKGGGEPSD